MKKMVDLQGRGYGLMRLAQGEGTMLWAMLVEARAGKPDQPLLQAPPLGKATTKEGEGTLGSSMEAGLRRNKAGGERGMEVGRKGLRAMWHTGGWTLPQHCAVHDGGHIHTLAWAPVCGGGCCEVVATWQGVGEWRLTAAWLVPCMGQASQGC